MSLPAPLDTVARWLLKAEGVLTEEEGDPQDHGRAADEAREKQELLKVNSGFVQTLKQHNLWMWNELLSVQICVLLVVFFFQDMK